MNICFRKIQKEVRPVELRGEAFPALLTPTYILHEDKISNTRERPSVKFAKLSINHIVGLVHKHILRSIFYYKM